MLYEQYRVTLAEPEKRRIMGQKYKGTNAGRCEKTDLCLAALRAALLT